MAKRRRRMQTTAAQKKAIRAATATAALLISTWPAQAAAAAANHQLPYVATQLLPPPPSCSSPPCSSGATTTYIFRQDDAGRVSFSSIDYTNGLDANLSLARLLSTDLPFLAADDPTTTTAFAAARTSNGSVLVYAGVCGGDTSSVWSFDHDAITTTSGGIWTKRSTRNNHPRSAPSFLGRALAFSTHLAPVMDQPTLYSFGGMCDTPSASNPAAAANSDKDKDKDTDMDSWQARASYNNIMVSLAPSDNDDAHDDAASYVATTVPSSGGPSVPLAGFTLTPQPPSLTNISGVVTQKMTYILLGGHTRQAFINMSTAAVWALPEQSWSYLDVRQPVAQQAGRRLLGRRQNLEPGEVVPARSSGGGGGEKDGMQDGNAPSSQVSSRSGHTAILSQDGTQVVVMGGWVGDINTPAVPQLAVLKMSQTYNSWVWTIPQNAQPPGADDASGIYGHGAALLPGNVMMVHGGWAIAPPSGQKSSSKKKRASAAASVADTARFLNLTSMQWTTDYIPPPHSPLTASSPHTTDPNAPSAAGPANNTDRARRLGLGLGLGLGIGLLLIMAATALAFRMQRRRRRTETDAQVLTRSDAAAAAATDHDSFFSDSESVANNQVPSSGDAGSGSVYEAWGQWLGVQNSRSEKNAGGYDPRIYQSRGYEDRHLTRRGYESLAMSGDSSSGGGGGGSAGIFADDYQYNNRSSIARKPVGSQFPRSPGYVLPYAPPSPPDARNISNNNSNSNGFSPSAGQIHPILEDDEDEDRLREKALLAPDTDEEAAAAVVAAAAAAAVVQEAHTLADPFQSPPSETTATNYFSAAAAVTSPTRIDREIQEWSDGGAEALIERYARNIGVNRGSSTRAGGDWQQQNLSARHHEDELHTAVSDLSELTARSSVVESLLGAGGVFNSGNSPSNSRSLNKPARSSSSASYRTAKSGFGTLQAAEVTPPSLLLRRGSSKYSYNRYSYHDGGDNDDEDDGDNEEDEYLDPGSPSKKKPRRGVLTGGSSSSSTWLGSLRRVLSGATASGSGSGSASPMMRDESSSATTTAATQQGGWRRKRRQGGRRSSVVVEQQRVTSGDYETPLAGVSGEILRRKQGRRGWNLSDAVEDEKEAARRGGYRRAKNDDADGGGDGDGVGRGGGGGGGGGENDDWDIERASEKRLVQVMFTVPKERLRVVNAAEDDVCDDEEEDVVVVTASASAATVVPVPVVPVPVEPEVMAAAEENEKGGEEEDEDGGGVKLDVEEKEKEKEEEGGDDDEDDATKKLTAKPRSIPLIKKQPPPPLLLSSSSKKSLAEQVQQSQTRAQTQPCLGQLRKPSNKDEDDDDDDNNDRDGQDTRSSRHLSSSPFISPSLFSDHRSSGLVGGGGRYHDEAEIDRAALLRMSRQGRLAEQAVLADDDSDGDDDDDEGGGRRMSLPVAIPLPLALSRGSPRAMMAAAEAAERRMSPAPVVGTAERVVFSRARSRVLRMVDSIERSEGEWVSE